MSNNILDGQTTAREFIEYLRDDLPDFYHHCVDKSPTILDTIKLLHETVYCNEPFEFDSDLGVEDPELQKYLHSLMIATKRSENRIRELYEAF